ncbi:nucleotidyltransferase family protein [Rhodococcus sp. IEGM 248]|uniref:nucleotidyltransferase family protein n=1 Tax=Rhodococcus opacus TaxID=37919 RepID=UPI0013C08F96|nr:nucleotidyltransferase family protein [Rhodococcus opacus]MDV7082608.1 nucleotidyltransferase family protein [Rhodococcus opacus]NDV03819.1 nucleotidyltransferase family protein [Rhodococcus sp. IEGM 248]
MTIGGVLLAAGAGSRMGMPKALVVGADGEPWLARGVRVLSDAGCAPTVVVLGARADEAEDLLPGGVPVTVGIAEDWQSGLSASLRRGLEVAATFDDVDAVVITLVDLPDLGVDAVRRVASVPPGDARSALRQAHYSGRPGHPVLIGRDHWLPLRRSLTGDSGARKYLGAHGAEAVDCSDLGSGRDVDSPRELR